MTPHPSQLRHSIPGQDNPARGFITAPWTLHSVCCQNEYITTIRPPKTCFKALLYFKGDILKVSRKSESQSFCECYLHRNILWASVLCGYICVCEMFSFIITLTEKCKLCYSMLLYGSQFLHSWAPHLYICILTLLCCFSHLPPVPGVLSLHTMHHQGDQKQGKCLYSH